MRRLTLILALIGLPAIADTDPASLTLSPSMKRSMEGDFLKAATHLANTFDRYARDSKIDLSTIDEVIVLEMAESRAGKVYGFLSVDLNWDGTVTRDELERVFATPKRRPFVDGHLKDGDLDGDGMITLPEMRAAAEAAHSEADTVNNANMQEMLGWDLNGDGILRFEEVLAVIEAHQK